MQTIFCNVDIDFYFLDFLSLKELMVYRTLSKSCFIIFTNSRYYTELKLYKNKYNILHVELICDLGYFYLFKSYVKDKESKFYNIAFKNAASYGQLEMIKYLVTLNSNNENKKCAIVSAAQYGHLNIIKYLISLNIDVDTIYNFAMQHAASNGHLETLKHLVSLGANIRHDNDYAIKWAAAEGHINVVKYLVSLGADFRADENCPIRWAYYRRHTEIVEYLISLGVNFDLAMNSFNYRTTYDI